MGNLYDDFSAVVCKIGMDELEHPIFYNAPVGIRFEIGGDEPVYTDDVNFIVNPEYISAAFDRATAIYTNLPHKPNILRIDCCPDENDVHEDIKKICETINMPLPDEQVVKSIKLDEDEEVFSQFQLYWNLENLPYPPSELIKKTINADIGGFNFLSSSVYYVDTRSCILFYLYDDRGADLVAADKETIRPIYEKFNQWILDYDREKIDAIFAE